MNAQPLTATPLIWPRALPTPLPRFLLLAVLLHVWLVLLLGNAPGGTAQLGQGVFGSLNIVLQGVPDGTQGAATTPPAPATPTGAPGEAEQLRFGGAVRDTLPQISAQPGAAQLGDWAPAPGRQPDGQGAGAAPEAVPDAAGPPAPPPDTRAAAPPAVPAAAPPSVLAAVPPSVLAAVPPAVLAAAPPAVLPAVPPPGQQPAAQAPPSEGATAVLGRQRVPVPVAAPEAALQRSAPITTATLPAVPAAPTLVVPAPLRQVGAAPLPPVVPQAALRSTPALATPEVPLPAAVPMPSALLPAASAEKQLASRLPAERAATVAAPLPGVARAPTAPALAAVPAPLTAPLAPLIAPSVAAPSVPAPAAPMAAAAPPSSPEPALQQLPRLAPAAQAGGPQPALPSTAIAAAAVTRAPLQNVPKPGALPVAPGQGAPDAGSRLGNDVATLPSTPASAPKRLNLELPRMRGGELSRHSTTGLLPALPRPPEVPDKLGRAIEKAAKEDCRKAYAAAGVLAVVPLAVDALREGGCKW